MASWTTRRKYAYFVVFVIAAIVLVGIPAYLLFYKAPTCDDGKKNGNERGVDCGGSCVKLCPADFADPKVLWSFSAKVVPGVYNAVAYAQNPNQSAEALSVPYNFKLYDAEGILVAERNGKAFVPAGQKFAVFEGGIATGERVPSRTIFEFTGDTEWRLGESLSKIRVDNIELVEGDSPRAEAIVRNAYPDKTLYNIDSFILLYDSEDNRISFSKTFIEKIGPGEEKTVYFTWPEKFSVPVVRKEVLFVMRPDK